MVEALNNESAEVNGIVPELHVEDAEASNSNGQGVVESAVVGDMKPAKPVGEPTGEEKTESLQNTSAAVVRKGASEKSETAKQQKSDDNAGPNGRIQAKLSGNSSDPVSAQTKSSGGAGRSVTDWSKVSKLRKSIVSYAKSLEGSRYVFGGVDPKSGIDCSGLILVVMRDKAGLDLDHYSTSQSMSETARQSTREAKTKACRLRLGITQSRLQSGTCSVTESNNRILTRQLRPAGFLLRIHRASACSGLRFRVHSPYEEYIYIDGALPFRLRGGIEAGNYGTWLRYYGGG